jgi:hypothetical protein
MSERDLRVERTPPRGWNSYDCYGCGIDEAAFRANARAMARELLPHGYEYACIDGLWYYDDVTHFGLGGVAPQPPHIDDHGRPIPSPARFPSSAGGRGFAPLAEFVHGLGLKFGIHLMRGIPRLAVERGTPIAGTDRRAADVADRADVCRWETTMYGVDTRRPGAQEWYDSLLALYASWGVDFIKADDCGNAPYHREEVAALSRAGRRCGRPILLSLSPGIDMHEVLPAHPHAAAHAEMWRISADIWDKWDNVRYLFPLCALWSGAIGPAGFPDADMLPYGMLGLGNTPTLPTRRCRLTEEEVRTHFTLLAMARSPLFFGGDVPQLDDFTRGVITHPELLAINARSRGNRPLWIWQLENRHVAWKAQDLDGPGQYLALFNLTDEAAEVSAGLPENGFPARARLRDLWARTDAGVVEKKVAAPLPPHGCAVYRVEPA